VPNLNKMYLLTKGPVGSMS